MPIHSSNSMMILTRFYSALYYPTIWLLGLGHRTLFWWTVWYLKIGNLHFGRFFENASLPLERSQVFTAKVTLLPFWNCLLPTESYMTFGRIVWFFSEVTFITKIRHFRFGNFIYWRKVTSQTVWMSSFSVWCNFSKLRSHRKFITFIRETRFLEL